MLEIETNKIYLADSYKFIKNIPDKSIDCIYTDIPYNIKSIKNKIYDKDFRNCHLRSKELEFVSMGIETEILSEFLRVSKKVNIFIWVNKFQFFQILKFINDNNLKFELLTWNKTNPIPMTSNIWLSDVEYCFWISEYGFKLNDGYSIKSKFYISALNTVDKKLYKHPNIKPLAFVKNHILHTTKENDIILDPFIGSGTTAVACIETGRKYIGIEKDKDYYKICLDRINGITQFEQTSIFTNFQLLNNSI